MKNIITLLVLTYILSLTGCATSEAMKFKDSGPRGITIHNIVKNERIQARLSADKHCAKYFKVALVLSSKAATDESRGMMVVECIKPNQ